MSEIQYCEWGLFFLKTSIFKGKKNKNCYIYPSKEHLVTTFAFDQALCSPQLNCKFLTLPFSQICMEKPEFSTNTLQQKEANTAMKWILECKITSLDNFHRQPEHILDSFWWIKNRLSSSKKEHFLAQTVLKKTLKTK